MMQQQPTNCDQGLRGDQSGHAARLQREAGPEKALEMGGEGEDDDIEVDDDDDIL